jgi:hypothetical protein
VFPCRWPKDLQTQLASGPSTLCGAVYEAFRRLQQCARRPSSIWISMLDIFTSNADVQALDVALKVDLRSSQRPLVDNASLMKTLQHVRHVLMSWNLQIRNPAVLCKVRLQKVRQINFAGQKYSMSYKSRHND